MPSGSFCARVHTVSNAGLSDPSNEVLFHVGVPVAPSTPADLVGVVASSRVALAWRNTFTGGAPSSLVLDVSGAVGPGTYLLSVQATNYCGAGLPSATLSVTVP